MMNSLLLLLLLLLLASAEMSFSYSIKCRMRFVKPTTRFFFSLFSYANKDLDIRPSIDDVEKISYGQAAKKRGVGSRGVPHRLNQEERLEWDLAKKRGYLVLKGTGFRKERQDSPLGNSWRNLADAHGTVALSIQRFNSEKGAKDILIVDYSPLRTTNNLDVLSKDILQISSKYNESISSIEDTNIQTLGFSNYEVSLTEHAIWTIPVTGLIFNFNDRKAAKLLAQELADIYINGVSQ